MAYDPSHKRYLRGSNEQCPKCGSRSVAADMELAGNGHGPGIAVCKNCNTVWEPFRPGDVWDTSDPHCSFVEPCNNCAFRPGSPEMADTDKWREMIVQLKAGGGFFCHKGIPIDPAAEHGFAYPKDTSKMRICRGYLKMMAAWWSRAETGTGLDEIKDDEREEILSAQPTVLQSCSKDGFR